jgi:hypothetical protein
VATPDSARYGVSRIRSRGRQGGKSSQHLALVENIARNASEGVHRTMLCHSNLNRRDFRSVRSRSSSWAREVHLERIDFEQAVTQACSLRTTTAS